jgi:hypothetical protein
VAQFSLIVSKSIGVGALTNPRVTYGSGLVDDFRVSSRSVFVDYFRVNKGGCVDE